jgi:hypothetical protein
MGYWAKRACRAIALLWAANVAVLFASASRTESKRFRYGSLLYLVAFLSVQIVAKLGLPPASETPSESVSIWALVGPPLASLPCCLLVVANVWRGGPLALGAPVLILMGRSRFHEQEREFWEWRVRPFINADLCASVARVGAISDASGPYRLTAGRRADVVQQVGRLLERGADVHAREASGLTALESALAMGQAEVAEVLREHGARE